jgi:sigma-B regulation protein RsbU (phosphoserine phosphatase)
MQALEQTRTPLDTFRAVRQGLAEAYGRLGAMMLSTRGLGEGEYRVVHLDLGEEAARDSDPWLSEGSPVHEGGIVARIIKVRRPQIIHNVDWSGDPLFCDVLAGYESLMAIPFASDRLPMTWVFLLKRGTERFTGVELEEAMLRVALVGSLLGSQTLSDELRRANERIDADARQVGELQRSLLPDPLPRIPGLEIAVSYEPSGRAGGDLYDFFPLDEDHSAGADGRWCIFIGDASGHGSAAAVVMAMVQSILHVHPTEVRGPADLLAHANRQLSRKRIGGFVTAFLGIYEPVSRRMIYASAGHPPPLLKAANDGGVSQLDGVANYPIGIDETETFRESTVELHLGDTLLLYTDGITEARGAQREMFEFDRLEQELRACDCPPERLIQHLRRAVTDFQQGQPPVDDQTLVAAKGI